MKPSKPSYLLLVPALFLFALPVISYPADEDGHVSDEPRTERPHNVKSVFVGGASSAGKSNYTIVESNGTQLGTSSDSANSAVLFAGELTYQSKYLLGAGLLAEGTRYNYSAGGSADGELGIYFMPRVAQSIGPFELWAGVGLGLMSTTLGGSSTGTVDGVTIILNNTNATSFAWTPRVGIDIDLTRRVFIGAQYSYTRTTFSIPFTATDGPNSITGSDDCTRSWTAAAVRLGSRF
jgi:opacity protein-like surface antigen